MTLHAVHTSEPWLTYEELAERMGCSVKTVERLKQEGMPFIAVGRRPLVRFRESEAKLWVERRKRDAAA